MPATDSLVQSNQRFIFLGAFPPSGGLLFLIFREINGLPLLISKVFINTEQNCRFSHEFCKETTCDLTLIKSKKVEKEHHSLIRKAFGLSPLFSL